MREWIEQFQTDFFNIPVKLDLSTLNVCFIIEDNPATFLTKVQKSWGFCWFFLIWKICISADGCKKIRKKLLRVLSFRFQRLNSD